MSTGREIRLVEGDEEWRAIEEASGLETQGDSREAALEKLDQVSAVDFETDGGSSDLDTADELDWFDD